jgi:hypothetical protein
VSLSLRWNKQGKVDKGKLTFLPNSSRAMKGATHFGIHMAKNCTAEHSLVRVGKKCVGPGFDWFWIGLGVLLDIWKWQAAAQNREQMPGYPAAETASTTP